MLTFLFILWIRLALPASRDEQVFTTERSCTSTSVLFNKPACLFSITSFSLFFGLLFLDLQLKNFFFTGAFSLSILFTCLHHRNLCSFKNKEHFLCTQLLHLIYRMELLPTPLLQTEYGNLELFIDTVFHNQHKKS